MRSVLVLSGLALLALLPTGQAHGLVNAGELEVLMVQDEASDVVTGLDYGYDLVQLYIGEAYVPGLGDGFYVHTILYGGVGDRPVIDGEQTVAFEFEIDGMPLERSFTTTDGMTFEGDFDQLLVVPGDGEVEVQRAFVLYPDGVGPGSKVTSIVAATFVNDEPRDVAPGGVFAPGGAVEVPQGDSAQVVESYTLQGPGGYLRTSMDIDFEAQTFTVVAHNPLKKGDQHIMLVLPANLRGWTVDVQGEGGEVKAGANTTFVLRLKPGLEPIAFEVRTDIGGRVVLTAERDEDGGVVLSNGQSNAGIGPLDPYDIPLPPTLPILALLGALLLARRVKG